MTNTNLLKTEIEPELINGFNKKHQCKDLPIGSKKELKQIFLEMEPDLVSYDVNKCILYIGEITVSGYNGQRGGNFHVGAVKKVAEAFSKFYLIKQDKAIICNNIAKLYPDRKFDEISCHFIVPEKSKFIKALGYREKLFKCGIMSLDIIPLSGKTKNTMLEILENAKKEMQK